MMQATLSRSIMRSALVEAVCGLTESSFKQLDLAAHHAARGIDFLDREIDRHHGVFAERSEKAGARREMADLDDVGGLRAQNRRRRNARHERDAAGGLQQATARELILVGHQPSSPG
jgi:hypothetical protein